MYQPLKVQKFLTWWRPSKYTKIPLSKATGHKTSNFQSYRLENKLLQELGDGMFIIISNTVPLKINPFIKFTWEDQHQLEFVTTIVEKSTTVDDLPWYENGIEFLIGLHKK